MRLASDVAMVTGLMLGHTLPKSAAVSRLYIISVRGYRNAGETVQMTVEFKGLLERLAA